MRNDQSPVVAGRSPLAVTKAGACELLGVSYDFAQEHVFPEIRVVRRSRRILVPVAELERWLEKNAALTIEAA